MASVMCLDFSMTEEDILGHTSAKCHLCTFCVTYHIHHNCIEPTHAKILGSTLECQASRGDSDSNCLKTW